MMLHLFRESFGRYVTIAILGLIALTFVFFGIDFTVTQSSFAARVNGESIPRLEFERQLRLEQSEIQQTQRIELTDDLHRAIRRDVVDRMVVQRLLFRRAEDAGYRVSDARIREALVSDPVFQAGGAFSQDLYVSLLTAEGLTPTGFEARQREAMTIAEWQQGLIDSSFITPAEFRRQIELAFERREVAYAAFPVANYLDGIEITDETVAEYHAANPGAFMTEETVDIEFVELSLAAVAAEVEISDEELREYYDAEIERYALGEERRVSHILIEPEGDDYQAAEAEVAAVLARLDAGEDFATLAAEVSDDPSGRNGGDLGWMARGVFEGPFEDALFAMNVGDIEGPVETEFGLHILRLEETRAADPEPFEAVRDQLRDELAGDEAYSTYIDTANDLANSAYEAFDDLATVAESYGLALETIDGLTRAGNTDRFVNPVPVLNAVFSDQAIATGENSDLIELSEELVAIVRVRDHHLPEALPFDDVADDIRAILTREAAEDRAAEAASAYYESLSADESGDRLAAAESLASEQGGVWNAPQWLERGTVGAPTGLVSLIFDQARPQEGEPQLLRTTLDAGDQAVVLFTRAVPGMPEDVSVAEREVAQARFREQLGNLEINAFAIDARESASVRVPDDIINPPGL